MKKKVKKFYWQYNPYWRYTNVKNAQISLIDKFGKYVNSIISKLGIKIIRTKYHQGNNVNSFIRNNRVKNLRNQILADNLYSFCNKFNSEIDHKYLEECIIKFDEIYEKWGKNYNSKGGMGYNNSLYLYTFIKILNIDTVVESGIARGFTTFIIDNALEKNKNLICFDINLSNIEYESKNAQYYEGDIEDYEINYDSNRTLIFFDDHVSHLDRLKFIKEKKIKYVIFDDDLSIFNLHSDGWPPLPSMNIIKNHFEFFSLDKINWLSNNKKGEMDISKIDQNLLSSIKLFIDNNTKIYSIIPDLFEITGYRNSSQTSFVEFK